MQHKPLVSIIIPHYNGETILIRCLQSLADFTTYPHEILLVDNASTDRSVGKAQAMFPQIQVVHSTENYGYAGGCNLGMTAAAGDYFVLLNNDAVVTSGWLEQLMKFAIANPEYGALQPKILSIDNDGWFDYAGAAGGKIDVFGFPFTRGRVFFTLEKDEGQYDAITDLFWASGTCTLLKRSALETTGPLDIDFFAHMEEIDLDWRLHLAGFKIGFVPESIVKHNAGSTLSQESPHKVYLNHRNNLEMLLKNYSGKRLAVVLPVRLIFQFLAMLQTVIKSDLKQTWAITRAMSAVMFRLPRIWEKRRNVQKMRVRSDAEIAANMYKGSIVWQYFVKGNKTYANLK
ncbi:MAG: glycosyltransferase family 2 protein [Calditrichaeota bacterium]|nr:MAG: glycosyltransferase family 2 protein [Calditrichota bacterium]